MASHTLHPSAAQLLHSPTAVAESVIVDALTNADPSKLMPPIDPSVVFDPANTSRPESVKPNGPRRLSISDSALLARALSTAAALPQSRPGSAEAARRVRTRQVVPTSQQIVGMGGAKVEGHTEVFCLAYTPNSEQLIAGCGDGTLRVFGTASNRLERVLQHTDDSERLPVTCMRFSPQPTKEGDRLLLVAYANGSVSHWNISGDNAACLRSFSEPTSSVYAADYDADGRHFATGGRDHVIRIYDAERDTLVRSMDNVGAHGHSNRVFVVKYHPTDEPVIVTGGWDNTLQLWDTRTGYSMRSIYGPHLCGDALSIRSDGREALTASWRDDDALQRWDLGTGKVIETIHWNGSAQQSSDARPKTCMLYGCAYSPDELTIAAGGCGNGVNQAKLFDNKTSQPTERVTMQHGVYCLAFAPSGKKLAIGGVDQAMSIINLE